MPYMEIPTSDGHSFKAYVTLPKKPAPAVIMIQEIFGVNQEMRDKCDEMAEAGYLAISPDLFWRIEPGIELMDDKPEQLERAFELYGIFDVEKGMDDLKDTVNYIRGFDGCNGEVGAVGYCLGGMLSFRLACEANLKAGVSYYGVGIEGLLDKAKDFKNHLMLHIAEDDEFVPPEAQEQIKLALMPNRRFEVHSYPACDHAFARKGGMHYNPTAAMEARERTMEFLNAALIDPEAA